MNGMSYQQKILIISAARYAIEIIRCRPEVVDNVRKGLFWKDIIREHGLVNDSKRDKEARLALTYVANGFKGAYGIKPFEGVFSDKKDLEKITRGKIRNGPKKIVEVTIKGIEGTIKLDASRYGVFLRGQIPWVVRKVTDTYVKFSELERAYMMSHDPRYIGGKKTRCSLIAKELNDIYHGGIDIRNTKTVSIALSKLKRRTNENSYKEKVSVASD